MYATDNRRRHFRDLYSEHKQDDSSSVKMPASIRYFFGIFMVLFFGFAGLMLLFDWFNVIYDPNWNWLRWVGGPILILYGIFRGYRFIKGQQDDEVEDEVKDTPAEK